MAIVVPTLDEESGVEACLAPVLAVAEEVIVADGGSRDRTVEVARRLGARVVSSPPGRGVQLNAGAAAAESDALLFLHADTRLPADGVTRVRAALAEGVEAGAFALRFDIERPIYRLAARLINLRTRLTGCPLGDQAQFVLRPVFIELEGFREWPILEDLDLARRLKRRARTVLLEPPVTTAARRYEKRGFARTAATNWLIWALYFAGVSPHRLARLYRR